MTNGDPTHQPALPDDAGNGMSDRSGSYDESESGMTNTPTFPRNPAAPVDAPASGTMTNTETTFGPDGDDEGR